MRKELDEKLCEKYPLIFQDRYGDASKTCMVWGLCCDDGWYDIIDTACNLIQNHINHSYKQIEWDKKWNSNVNDPNHIWTAFVERKERPVRDPIPQVVATQIKEKFGGLRFYYNGGDDYIQGVVTMAEEMSYITCETCGNPGKVRNGGWIRTLCDEHNN